MFLRGVARKINPQLEVLLTLLLQGWFYLIPLALIWYGTFKKDFLYVILLYLYIFIIQFFVEHQNIVAAFLNFKSYFAAFLFIPLFQYLIDNDPQFDQKIRKHFFILTVCFAAVAIFESISLLLPNPLNSYFKSLSYFGDEFKTWRPLGLYLNIHTQGPVLAIGSLYCLLVKKWYLFVFLMISLLICGTKTWVVAFGVTLFLLVLFRYNAKYKIVLTAFILCSTLIFAIMMPSYWNYYMQEFGLESYGSQRMTGQLKELSLLKLSMVPNGFYIRSSAGLQMQGEQKEIPFEVSDNEIFILDFMYQIGPIGLLLWMFNIYKPLFSLKEINIFKNDYKVILFVSLACFVHTANINNIFLFIFLLFLGLQGKTKSRFT